MSDFLPSASLANLRRRAQLLRATREFFDARGAMEVDTPLMSADIVVDAWIEPIVTRWRPDPYASPEAGEARYLQTSPEFAMKRLLAAGATHIYQLGKVFRNGEIGRRHNPEFTMLEWYRVGDELPQQIQFTADYLAAMWQYVIDTTDDWTPTQRATAQRWRESLPLETLTYDDAFQKYTGLAALTSSIPDLQVLARQRGLVPPESLSTDDRDDWLNWLLAELVEPQLGHERPVCLCDYPATQSALAKTVQRPDGVWVARRFELYLNGVEFCNGYHELTQPEELRRRNRAQSAVRAAAGLQPLPNESRLLAAMDAGFPESSGVALGFDRLVQHLVGAETLAEVLPFAFDRA